MTYTHIANLLPPLQSAIALQSWEDAEDIATEITRLCRLKRLSELQKIQEAIRGREPVTVALKGSQVAKTPTPVTIETRFELNGHAEPWRNEVAKELNTILDRACWLLTHHKDLNHARAVKSIAARVAQFEEILQVKP